MTLSCKLTIAVHVLSTTAHLLKYSSTLVAGQIEPQPLKVIYAGFGRFGTTSLSAGLERLGYNPSHGSIIAPGMTGSQANLADALIEGDVDAILRITSVMGHNATLECHAVFWREIVELTPNAKVVFMLRDFEPWFKSMAHLFSQMAPAYRYPLRSIAFWDKLAKFTFSLCKGTLAIDDINLATEIVRNPTTDLSRNAYRKVYDKFVLDANEMMKNEPNRTLMFNLKDGYPPLCKFLDISAEDCPSDDFPHVFDASTVRKQGIALRITEAIIYIAIFVLVRFILKPVKAWIHSKNAGGKNKEKKRK